VAVCLTRFHADGEKRRKRREPDRDRTFDDAKADPTKGTFACGFYDQLLTGSPCEKALSIVKIRLFDPQGRALPFAPCVVTEDGKEPRPDRATGAPPSPQGTYPGSPPGSDSTPKGAKKEEDGFIKLRVADFPAKVNVKWSRPKKGEGPGAPLPVVDPAKTDDEKKNREMKLKYKFEFEMDVVIALPEDDSEATSQSRLKNLGYVQVPKLVDDPIRAFQTDYKPRFADIVVDGTLNPPTSKAIRTVHDGCDPVLKTGSNIELKR
jgi:hypothetical protein